MNEAPLSTHELGVRMKDLLLYGLDKENHSVFIGILEKVEY